MINLPEGVVVKLVIEVLAGKPSPPPTTVNPKLAVAVRAPSETESVMVVLPELPVTGVTFTVRFDPLPPRLIAATNAGLAATPERRRLAGGVSESPITNGIAGVA